MFERTFPQEYVLIAEIAFPSQWLHLLSQRCRCERIAMVVRRFNNDFWHLPA